MAEKLPKKVNVRSNNSAEYPVIYQFYQNLRKFMVGWRKYEVAEAENAMVKQAQAGVPDGFE